jgi:hypothetical protein
LTGGGVIVDLCETLGELDDYIRNYNKGVEAIYTEKMAQVEAINLEDPEATERAKKKYRLIAQRNKEHDSLRNGGELAVGQKYRAINQAFSSDDHALGVVHGVPAVEHFGPFARTSDGVLTDEMHKV